MHQEFASKISDAPEMILSADADFLNLRATPGSGTMGQTFEVVPMWALAGQISSGFGLLAFLVTVIASAYRASLKSRLKAIRF